ncbi:MAG: hypothetical protein V4568_18165 [Pseudomonadota bacterium]
MSAWSKGIQEYKAEILEHLENENLEITLENALNGARDWKEFSYGGCSLIYNADIAERLCTPSELKRKKGGDLNPSSRETWCDVQARALYQAWLSIRRDLRGKQCV